MAVAQLLQDFYFETWWVIFFLHSSTCPWKCDSGLRQINTEKDFSPCSAQDYQTLQEDP